MIINAHRDLFENNFEVAPVQFSSKKAEEYVDLLPDGSAMPKYELQKKLQERQKKQAMIDKMQLQVEQEQSKLQQAMMQQDNTMSSIDSIQNEANGMQQQLMQQLGGGANELSEMPVA